MKLFNQRALFSPTSLFLTLLFIAISLRLYNLTSGYGYFSDQGRDLVEIYRWVLSGEIPLLGPQTSVGEFHLGPLYYYLLLPFFVIFNGDPISGVVLNTISAVLLIVVVYSLLIKYSTKLSAFIASLVLTLSFHAIFLARGSWNPNPQPLFFVLHIYSLLNFLEQKKNRYLYLAFFILGMGVQLHYTFAGNIIASVLALVFFYQRLFKDPKKLLGMTVSFFLPLVPYLIGQIQNGFLDLQSLRSYLLSDIRHLNKVSHSILSYIIYPFKIFFIPEIEIPYIESLVVVLVLSLLFYLTFKKVKNQFPSQTQLVIKVSLIYLVINIFLLKVLNIELWWWYFEHFAVVTIILISLALGNMRSKIKYLFFAGLVTFELSMLPYAYRVNRTPQVVRKEVQRIISDIKQNNYPSEISLYINSPVTDPRGFEYRYLLAKKGIFVDNRADATKVSYLVIEGRTEADTKLAEGEIEGIEKIEMFTITDKSFLIRSSVIYRLINNE